MALFLATISHCLSHILAPAVIEVGTNVSYFLVYSTPTLIGHLGTICLWASDVAVQGVETNKHRLVLPYVGFCPGT